MQDIVRSEEFLLFQSLAKKTDVWSHGGILRDMETTAILAERIQQVEESEKVRKENESFGHRLNTYKVNLRNFETELEEKVL